MIKTILLTITLIVAMFIMFSPIFVAIHTGNYWYLFLFFVTVFISKVFVVFVDIIINDQR